MSKTSCGRECNSIVLTSFFSARSISLESISPALQKANRLFVWALGYFVAVTLYSAIYCEFCAAILVRAVTAFCLSNTVFTARRLPCALTYPAYFVIMPHTLGEGVPSCLVEKNGNARRWRRISERRCLEETVISQSKLCLLCQARPRKFVTTRSFLYFLRKTNLEQLRYFPAFIRHKI